jgi:hypothetical protein
MLKYLSIDFLGEILPFQMTMDMNASARGSAAEVATDLNEMEV